MSASRPSSARSPSRPRRDSSFFTHSTAFQLVTSLLLRYCLPRAGVRRSPTSISLPLTSLRLLSIAPPGTAAARQAQAEQSLPASSFPCDRGLRRLGFRDWRLPPVVPQS